MNKLSGKIPDALSSTSSPHDLLFNENRFSGKIPDATAAWTSLFRIWIMTNQLSDTIPDAMASWTRLANPPRSYRSFWGAPGLKAQKSLPKSLPKPPAPGSQKSEVSKRGWREGVGGQQGPKYSKNCSPELCPPSPKWE